MSDPGIAVKRFRLGMKRNGYSRIIYDLQCERYFNAPYITECSLSESGETFTVSIHRDAPEPNQELIR